MDHCFTRVFLRRYPIIAEDTIDALISNGYTTKDLLLVLDINEDLKDIPISMAQRSALRRVLSEFQKTDQKTYDKSLEKQIREDLNQISAQMTSNHSMTEPLTQSSAVAPVVVTNPWPQWPQIITSTTGHQSLSSMSDSYFSSISSDIDSQTEPSMLSMDTTGEPQTQPLIVDTEPGLVSSTGADDSRDKVMDALAPIGGNETTIVEPSPPKTPKTSSSGKRFHCDVDNCGQNFLHKKRFLRHKEDVHQIGCSSGHITNDQSLPPMSPSSDLRIPSSNSNVLSTDPQIQPLVTSMATDIEPQIQPPVANTCVDQMLSTGDSGEQEMDNTTAIRGNQTPIGDQLALKTDSQSGKRFHCVVDNCDKYFIYRNRFLRHQREVHQIAEDLPSIPTPTESQRSSSKSIASGRPMDMFLTPSTSRQSSQPSGPSKRRKLIGPKSVMMAWKLLEEQRSGPKTREVGVDTRYVLKSSSIGQEFADQSLMASIDVRNVESIAEPIGDETNDSYNVDNNEIIGEQSMILESISMENSKSRTVYINLSNETTPEDFQTDSVIETDLQINTTEDNECQQTSDQISPKSVANEFITISCQTPVPYVASDTVFKCRFRNCGQRFNTFADLRHHRRSHELGLRQLGLRQLEQTNGDEDQALLVLQSLQTRTTITRSMAKHLEKYYFMSPSAQDVENKSQDFFNALLDTIETNVDINYEYLMSKLFADTIISSKSSAAEDKAIETTSDSDDQLMPQLSPIEPLFVTIPKPSILTTTITAVPPTLSPNCYCTSECECMPSTDDSQSPPLLRPMNSNSGPIADSGSVEVSPTGACDRLVMDTTQASEGNRTQNQNHRLLWRYQCHCGERFLMNSAYESHRRDHHPQEDTDGIPPIHREIVVNASTVDLPSLDRNGDCNEFTEPLEPLSIPVSASRSPVISTPVRTARSTLQSALATASTSDDWSPPSVSSTYHSMASTNLWLTAGSGDHRMPSHTATINRPQNLMPTLTPMRLSGRPQRLLAPLLAGSGHPLPRLTPLAPLNRMANPWANVYRIHNRLHPYPYGPRVGERLRHPMSSRILSMASIPPNVSQNPFAMPSASDGDRQSLSYLFRRTGDTYSVTPNK